MNAIEQLFYDEWQHLLREYNGDGLSWGLILHPQFSVRIGAHAYRLDFRVGPQELEDGPLTAIEIDGHDFHERTREQVKLRDERDRKLQVYGYKVLHISGSALMSNPKERVEEIYDNAQSLVLDYMFEQSRKKA